MHFTICAVDVSASAELRPNVMHKLLFRAPVNTRECIGTTELRHTSVIVEKVCGGTSPHKQQSVARGSSALILPFKL
jgi:hypothetical protein